MEKWDLKMLPTGWMNFFNFLPQILGKSNYFRNSFFFCLNAAKFITHCLEKNVLVQISKEICKMFSAFKPGSLRLECSNSWNSQFNVFDNGLTSKCTIFALENLYWHSKLKKKCLLRASILA